MTSNFEKYSLEELKNIARAVTSAIEKKKVEKVQQAADWDVLATYLHRYLLKYGHIKCVDGEEEILVFIDSDFSNPGIIRT